MKKTITSHHYSENLVLVVIVEALERLFPCSVRLFVLWLQIQRRGPFLATNLVAMLKA